MRKQNNFVLDTRPGSHRFTRPRIRMALGPLGDQLAQSTTLVFNSRGYPYVAHLNGNTIVSVDRSRPLPITALSKYCH